VTSEGEQPHVALAAAIKRLCRFRQSRRGRRPGRHLLAQRLRNPLPWTAPDAPLRAPGRQRALCYFLCYFRGPNLPTQQGKPKRAKSGFRPLFTGLCCVG